MRAAWRMVILPPALITLVFTSVARAAGTVNFDFYPKDAQRCLYKAADSSNCDSGAVDTTNSCLCTNGGNFVTNSAQCLGKSDKKDLSEVYFTMQEACSDSKTPLTVSEQQYLADAGVSDKTLTSVQPTSTNPPSATKSEATASSTSTQTPGEGNDQGSGDKGDDNNKGDENKGSGSGMSTGVKAGVIAGGAVAGLAVLGVVGFIILRYRKRKDGEESHPMLPPENGHISLVPTAAETSALMAIDTPKGDWPNDAKWRPSSGQTEEQRKSMFNWESPYDLAYPGTLKPGKTPSPPGSPPLTSHSSVSHLSAARSGVFELQGSDRQPAEAPSVPLETGSQPVSIPVPRSSAASSRYSGSDWTEINPEPETPGRSRANSSR